MEVMSNYKEVEMYFMNLFIKQNQVYLTELMEIQTQLKKLN